MGKQSQGEMVITCPSKRKTAGNKCRKIGIKGIPKILSPIATVSRIWDHCSGVKLTEEKDIAGRHFPSVMLNQEKE
ncbi:hypothetical protein AVEN_104076-1, partial [Araneus ventricosus]